MKNVSVAKAAAEMGVSAQFVRIGLQRGILKFGSAVKMNGSRYTYHISEHKLSEYLGRKINMEEV